MHIPEIITVTLNPCIDKAVEISDFQTGKTNRVLNSRSDIGGKGINVSLVLNTSDTPSLATGLVAGVYGKKIIDRLDSLGIANDFAEAEGETRVNTKVLDINSGVMTEINEKGFFAGSSFDVFRSNLISVLPHAKVLVLSGSTPPDVGTGIYKELINIAKEHGVKVILDADGDRLKKGIEASPYAIKPNFDEFCELIGKVPSSIDEIIDEAKLLNESGINTVVVSLGENGAVFVRDSLAIHTTPFPIDFESSAACGDSMVAALAYATVNGLTLLETARLMTAAGTLTASKPGTHTSEFCEIFKYADSVSVQIIDN
ncbi:MAG: 1-phosphofructokinase family hexose kinase [Clostridia bacterium]|nr:1-phosphofructokinase family hexose kinase [Clostridia bacterium]